jgi:hypothetical protein
MVKAKLRKLSISKSKIKVMTKEFASEVLHYVTLKQKSTFLNENNSINSIQIQHLYINI